MHAAGKGLPSIRSIPVFFSIMLFGVLVWLVHGPDLTALAHPANEESPLTAIYRSDRLSLSIPYHITRGGPGMLTVELIDPEDQVLDHVERTINTKQGDGVWTLDLKMTNILPLQDVVWQRIRYRFQYSGDSVAAFEETRSVSEILRRPVLHILGQTSYVSSAQAAIRVVVSDSANHEIPGRSSIRIELVRAGQPSLTLFAGHLNSRGTAEAQFQFPAGVSGSCELHYIAETPLGTAEFTQPVRLEQKVSILLTTEKRLYQPGQTVHVRTLALDRADHHAVAPGPITFEILDPRGNKVFKQQMQTDEFGIASAEFTLADEVNLGSYQLRALMGDSSAPSNSADLTFTVDRYVLPKFKVAVDFAAKNGKPRREYRPGDHVSGTVQANYFFGKPVGGAEIDIKASRMDVAVVEASSAHGRTDKDGTYHFDLPLPLYFAGRSQSGTAAVLIEATVKDDAGHPEARGEAITVSESALLVTAIPEGGTLIPGLENQVFLLTSYADGTPAKADLQVRSNGGLRQHAATDDRGVAVVRITPGAAAETLMVEARDSQGNHLTTKVPLQPRGGTDQVLLRPDRAVYKAGDRMLLSIYSTGQGGSAYVDIVKDGQTILTRDLNLTGGHGDLGITATAEMAGTLDINVYRFGADAQVIGDHRLVFVEPAEELRIETVADSPVYKPGAEAHVRFRVTNAQGQAVRAALGLQVVDEAVFALAEKRPGFAKTFFYLEQELMKPRFEIHSLSLPEVVEPTSEMDHRRRDLAAQALFSATYSVNPNKLEVAIGKEVPQEKAQEFRERYRAAFAQQVQDLAARTIEERERAHPNRKPMGDRNPMDIVEAMRQGDGGMPRDAWDTPLRFVPMNWSNKGHAYYRVRSAGPDRQFDTRDDFSLIIDSVTGRPSGSRSGSAGQITVKIEHDRGPFNGLAEISGTVTDSAGAVVSGAVVRLSEVNKPASRRTRTDAEGQFTLAAIPAGDYQIEISSPGFVVGTKGITLQARDRAFVVSTLWVGSATQTVEVMAAAPMMAFAGRQLQMNARVAGDGLMVQAPSAAPRQMFAAKAAFKVGSLQEEQKDEGKHETHVRSYFPEALYINPEIITDRNGVASVTIPMADSITTWRMAMLASSTTGALGTANSALKVFTDFFVDLDLPVTLTQGDRVSVPVAIYNYSGARGEVKLSLQSEDWFGLAGDSPEKSVSVESARVAGSSFTLETKRIGRFKLTLSAQLTGAARRRDIVVREIEVVPNGREQNIVFNGRLETAVQHTVHFPANSIPDASKIFVRLYPGPLSQVIEGMDSILRMPGGCFEQTSSSTYPNVLALDYMKRTNKLTPEVHAKAEGYIVNGYQRLLTFEVQGGGFSWFGNAPANKILTAYGLMEFNDMSKVHEVDPNLIQRTRDWLISQEQQDGSWKPDASFINEGATNRYNSDVLRITAYIAWALENTGYRGEAIERAKRFAAGHLSGKVDAYTLAVLANFAVESADQAFTQQAMNMLLDARTEKDEKVFWNSEETGVYSTGSSAAVETTGLAVQALLKWRQSPETVRKALAYIRSMKDESGAWGTTQATIMSLRALLMASEEGGADARGTVEVTLNGKRVQTLVLTAQNSDLFHQFVLPGVESRAANSLEIKFAGKGGLAYQIVGRHFVPWDVKPVQEPLSIDITYDRAKLTQNEIVTANATIRNNLSKVANMVMVDLGIPPGFELLSEDLQAFKEKTAGLRTGGLEKFTLTSTQAMLYFNSFAPHSKVDLHFRLRAKFPIRARTFQSRVYEYYDPALNAVARPQLLEVTEHR